MAPLTDEEIRKTVEKLNGWEYQEKSISKEFVKQDFASALSFVNKVGEEAERMDHHPDILLHSYKKVRITLSTHSEGGVTDKDFALAKLIEAASLGED